MPYTFSLPLLFRPDQTPCYDWGFAGCLDFYTSVAFTAPNTPLGTLVVFYRPLLPYDQSCGPLPAQPVDTPYLLARYGITKPTLLKRRDALVENGWVVLHKSGVRVFYETSSVHLLDCCHFWIANNYTLAEIITHLQHQEKTFRAEEYEVEEDNAFAPNSTIEVKSENTTTDLVVKGIQTSAKDLQQLGDEFIEKFASKVGDAVKMALPSDLLEAHDFLSRCADKGYVVPRVVLAKALGISSKSISNWDNRIEKLGFAIIKVSKKGMFRVEKVEYDDAEETEETQPQEGEMREYFKKLLKDKGVSGELEGEISKVEKGGETPSTLTDAFTGQNPVIARGLVA